MDFEKFNLKIDECLRITDIHTDYYGDKIEQGIQLLTPNGDYIELYDDGHWEFFKREVI